jgi:hypothetical protein
VYRAQRVDIDDKHIEIICSQMLRKVKVATTGDNIQLLPGIVMDKFTFQELNRRLVEECVKINNPVDSQMFREGEIVTREAYEEELDQGGGIWKTGADRSVPRCYWPTIILGLHVRRCRAVKPK